jgi:hypothetical protein
MEKTHKLHSVCNLFQKILPTVKGVQKDGIYQILQRDRSKIIIIQSHPR